MRRPREKAPRAPQRPCLSPSGWIPFLLAAILLTALPSLAFAGKGAAVLALEKQVRRHLQNRVLVFRGSTGEGPELTFTAGGRLLGEVTPLSPPATRALYFLSFEIHPERLELTGEALRLSREQGRRRYHRNPDTLDLFRCQILLDLSPEELTLEKVLAILVRVFLSRDELTEERDARAPEVP